MKDAELKKMLAEVIRNKELIYEILGSQRPEDIANGDIYLNEAIFNRSLRKLAIEKAYPYLIDYQINFIDNHVLASVDVNVKQIGIVSLSYKIKMLEFSYNTKKKDFTIGYYEQSKSRGNVLQSTMLKVLASKRPLLKTAADLIKKDGIKATNDLLMIDMEELLPIAKAMEGIVLKWEELQKWDIASQLSTERNLKITPQR